MIHKTDFDFVPGKAFKIADGDDVVIFATGSMVNVAMKAQKKLTERGINASIYDVHTIKPFDAEAVINEKDKRLIASVEEHSIVGGLGSAISEVLAEQTTHGRLLRFGTSEKYEAAGNYNYMLEVHGLTPENIVNTIIKKMEEY